MFALLICALTLHYVHSECDVPFLLICTWTLLRAVLCPQQDICPEDPEVQAEIVDAHNAHRRAVVPVASNMLKMNYSEEIAAVVQAWLDSCILAHGPPSARALNGYSMGENLFYGTKTDWQEVIDAWYNEVSNFEYPDISTNGKPTGHYTQVVWYSSYKVGCGVKLCPNDVYFYGCQYYRAGNFVGWRPYETGSPCGLCPNDCEDKLCTNPCPYIDQYINCPELKRVHGCGHSLVYAWCPASCTCTTEIIAIG